MGTSSSGGARRPQMGGRREPAVNVKGWRGGQSPAPATGYFFSWRERRRSPSQRRKEGKRRRKGRGRAPGRRPWLLDRRGSFVRRHIHAPPHFRLGAFSVQMLQPRCRHPPGTPEAEGDSRACRGMAGGAGGLCAVSGGSSAGAGRGAAPGAARWQPAPLRARSAAAASRPRRGAPRLPGIPAALCEQRPGQAFRAGIPWKTEGLPSQRLFRNARRRRGQSSEAPTPSRDKILPFPSLPPALLGSFCFSFLFYFPLSLSKGLPAFP